MAENAANVPMRFRAPAATPEWTSGANGMNQQIGPRELIRVLHRYRTLILTIVGVVTIAVLCHELLAPTLYRSTSNLQIELIDEVGTNQADVNSRNAERVANAVRLHRSRSAAEQVIRDLDLLHDARFLHELGDRQLEGKDLIQAATNRLLGMVTINAQAGSDLVEVVVTSRSPDLAAAIANQLPASVRKLRSSKSNERRAKLLGSLERELTARDATAKAAARRVSEFRQENRMLVGAGGEEDLAQINRIAVQSIAASAAKDGSAARAAGVARASAIQSTATATSGVLDQLQRRRGELLAEMSKLNTSLGPNHPDVKRLNAQVVNVDNGIASEQSRVQASARAMALAESARMTQLARSEAASTAAQASRLAGVVDDLNGSAYRNSRNMVDLNILVRDAHLASDAYEAIASRVEQVRAQMQLEGVSSSLVSPAVPDYDPVSPLPLKMTVTALLSSAVLAFLVAFTRDFLDDKLRTVVQIRRLFGLPTLGMLPLIKGGISEDPKKSPVISEPQSLLAEVARSAYCEVRALRRKPGAQVVLISSPLPGDGKSTVSLTLAAAGLAMGEKTVILDLDLRKVGALQRLEHEMTVLDLVDVVCGRADLDSLDTVPDETPYDGVAPLLDPTDGRRFVLLSAKEPVAEPAVLLSSSRLRLLLQQLRERFDLVIINAPAALAVRDARAMCLFADQTVVVARWGHTTADQMRAALEMLDSSVAGVIFDRVDYAEHARRRYGDSVQFYADSASYYRGAIPLRPTMAERLRRFAKVGGWRAAA
jgi:uncharacterized protein involved in exopolysaccharide biosynthesis/Mrp family chromosome partitioning ATPase